MQNAKAKKYLDRGIAWLVWSGGFLAAIMLPAILVVACFVVPFAHPAILTFLLKIVDKVEIKIALFFIIALPIWYGLNNILNVLMESRITIRHSELLFYGLAFAWSAQIGYVLFILETIQ